MSTHGRISRSTFWVRFVLPLGTVQGLAVTFDHILWEISWSAVRLSTVVAIMIAWPAVVGIVRRLHDLGHTGWLVPFVAGGTGVGTPIMITAAPEIGPAIVILSLPVLTLLLGIVWFGFRVAFVRGNRGPNRHGEDPLQARQPYRRAA